MDYIISIKVKNQHWYDAAEENENVKKFKKWDDDKTPRYKKGTTFKFAFSVQSMEKTNHSSHTLRQYRNIHNDDFIEVMFNDMFVMKFNEGITGELVISKSILEQVMENKKADGKYYIYCYLKDTVVYEILPNLWLSAEHFEIFKNPEYSKMITPKVEIIEERGIIEI